MHRMLRQWLFRGWVCLLGGLAGPGWIRADELKPLPAALDPAIPARITGELYQIGSHRQTLLYRFIRTASRSGPLVRVERRFITPDGRLATLETVRYESNSLAAYQLKDFQADLSGSIQISPDPARPGRSLLRIGYAKGPVPAAGEALPLKPDTLMDDDIYPFMLAHWDDLMHGRAVKFRFISLEWRRTFNFQLVKTGTTTVNGRAAVLLAMKPSGFLLSELVNPLIFTLAQAPPHEIFSYTGRTTPRVKKGDAWKYLDAETVFDLDAVVVGPAASPPGATSGVRRPSGRGRSPGGG